MSIGWFGPYTFLVALIEEPWFKDNHAGFQFWVRDHDRPIDELDTTLHAFAVGPTESVALTIGPRVSNGFYQVEFYPGDAVRYSLHLVGRVEDLAVDESFAVVFPTYPRVEVSSPGTGDAIVPTTPPGLVNSDLPLVWLLCGIALLTPGVAAVVVRRRKSTGARR
jgi:hypothetical protein